jgi:hypothetical protein
VATEKILAVEAGYFVQYDELDGAVGVGEDLFDLKGVVFRQGAARDAGERTAKQPIYESMHDAPPQ